MRQASSSAAIAPRTEFDILKSRHKFLREDDEKQKLSWDDQIAQKYYASLYREFAVCDLKHYKSGDIALRWRSESEVLSGAGETSCGNTRCPLHAPLTPQEEAEGEMRPRLSTLELPFAYEEEGVRKEARVKIVLCSKCVKKIMWRKTQEKRSARDELADEPEDNDEGLAEGPERPADARAEVETSKEQGSSRREQEDTSSRRRRRSSRSLSPRGQTRQHKARSGHRRSPSR